MHLFRTFSRALSLAFMPTLTSSAPVARHPRATPSPIAKAALLFWLFSYVLFTTRVQLSADEPGALLSMRRFAATAVGAFLYAGFLRFLIFPAGRRPAHPLVLIAAVIPAAALLVGFRAIADPLVSAAEDALPMAEHIRWVLIWSGYFGLWLIGFQAWRTYSERTSAKAVAAAEAPTPEKMVALIDAVAQEAARLTDAERVALLRGDDRGYQVSDDPFDRTAERDAIIRRIAVRMRR